MRWYVSVRFLWTYLEFGIFQIIWKGLILSITLSEQDTRLSFRLQFYVLSLAWYGCIRRLLPSTWHTQKLSVRCGPDPATIWSDLHNNLLGNWSRIDAKLNLQHNYIGLDTIIILFCTQTSMDARPTMPLCVMGLENPYNSLFSIYAKLVYHAENRGLGVNRIRRMGA